MRKLLIASVLTLLTACSEEKPGKVMISVPWTVGKVTYQWPTNTTTDLSDLGSPDRWKNHGYLPVGLWNELMSPVPGLHQTGWDGQIMISLFPAREPQWSIQPDGTGLPLSSYERFEITERGTDFTVGRVVGEGILAPPVLVTFDGERQAYAECSAIDIDARSPIGLCYLLLYDRGVVHRIPFGWEAWKHAKLVLHLYRALIGIPKPV